MSILSKCALFLCFTIGVTISTLAAVGERSIQFEWEPIEGAVEYEMELKPRTDIKENATKLNEYKFKSSSTVWEGFVSPGYYWLKIRSRDERGVPGKWSDAVEFNVLLETPEGVTPTKGFVLSSGSGSEEEVRFEWRSVPRAEEYLLQVQSSDGKAQWTERTKDFEKSIKLPIAKEYRWSVRASSSEGLQSEESPVMSFLIQGAQLEAPEIEKPESPFVRNIKWSTPEQTEKFIIQLDQYEVKSKKWRNVMATKDQKEAELIFDSQWSGGRYRLSVQATAMNRKESKISRLIFPVREGDRSEQAQNQIEMRESIERKGGLYFLASYFVTQMSMSSGSRIGSELSQIEQEPIGGTGRLGLGWQSKKTPWGYFGWLDLSGFLFNNRTITFGSLELNAGYRQPAGALGELRWQSGFYIKEMPQVRIASLTATDIVSDFTSITLGGLHFGSEYWLSMSSKLGVQLNAHMYYNFLNLGISGASSVTAALNPQIGIMGSYKLSPQWTGLMGYTYRKEGIYFTASDGSENETRLTGHYLSFYTEYYF